MAEEKTILLTQEAYDKMKEELAWREGEYRDEICPRSPRRVPKAI